MRTPPRGRLDDLQLEPPHARHGGVVPAAEDRSYLLFVAGAIFLALTGGFLLAILLPLAETGTLPWAERVPRLIQAHGWAQLQGWAGLFVGGMALRLIPRFARRKPLSSRATILIFAALFGGATGRLAVQSFFRGMAGQVGFIAAGAIASAGMSAVAAALAFTLARGRKTREPWRWFAWAGTFWWGAWATLNVVASIRGAGNGLFVPARLDEAMTWVVMLGAVGNFIWAVQSRSVPIFFGRKTPSLRRVLVPALLLNAGLLAVLGSALLVGGERSERLGGGGLALAGAGVAWLAPLAGSVWGRARRLRPRAQGAARYVLAANLFAVVAGALLIWTGAASAVHGQYELGGVRDAARHAFGLGAVTLLIVGMAQLVAPMFALERAEHHTRGLRDQLMLAAFLVAAVLRIGAGLLTGQLSGTARLHLASFAGSLAWLGLALFAFSAGQAICKEPKMRRLLTDAGRGGKE